MRRKLWQRPAWLCFTVRDSRPKSWYDAGDVSWTSVTKEKDHASWPITPHGGDITILPDPDFEASDE